MTGTYLKGQARSSKVEKRPEVTRDVGVRCISAGFHIKSLAPKRIRAVPWDFVLVPHAAMETGKVTVVVNARERPLSSVADQGRLGGWFAIRTKTRVGSGQCEAPTLFSNSKL